MVPDKYTGNGEETGLHDGVDAPPHAHAGSLGNGIGIDDPKFDVLFQHLFLHGSGQGLPDLLGRFVSIEQEYGTSRRLFQQVESVHELGLVTADEARLTVFDEIAGAYGTRAEAQVGNCHRTSFLGVVHEVSLHELIGFFTDAASHGERSEGW